MSQKENEFQVFREMLKANSRGEVESHGMTKLFGQPFVGIELDVVFSVTYYLELWNARSVYCKYQICVNKRSSWLFKLYKKFTWYETYKYKQNG